MPIQYFAVMELEQIAAVVRGAHANGVIGALGEAPMRTEALAKAAGGNVRAYQFLMNILEALGYVQARDGGYVASQELRDMRKDQSFNWDHLSQFLATGTPWKEIDRTLDDLDDFYVNFFEDMEYADQMLPVAKAVARKLELRPARILDIGAGTGVWSLEIAALRSDARVTAVDLPEVLGGHFEQRAAARGFSGRFDIRPGDFHQLDYPVGAYDCVLMGQSFQFVREEQSESFLVKAAAALAPGGHFVAVHHFADATPQQRMSRRLYEMRLAMRSRGTKNYSRSEMETLCRQADMELVNSFEVDGPGFLSVMVFRKPSASS
jgi:cyclopropane fatty-acyl-phospholipid synthase-like methyltransferase